MSQRTQMVELRNSHAVVADIAAHVIDDQQGPPGLSGQTPPLAQTPPSHAGVIPALQLLPQTPQANRSLLRLTRLSPPIVCPAGHGTDAGAAPTISLNADPDAALPARADCATGATVVRIVLQINAGAAAV